MKKIFAIALAMVMVFSMASAFALNDCATGFDWTCSTTNTCCGKAKVEVVPYVKVNNGCGGYNWQVNDCATAIVSENVYFALKLTVESYLNEDWWNAATTSFTTEGLDLNVTWDEYAGLDTIDVEFCDADEQVFYLGLDGKWVSEDNAVFKMNGNNVIFGATVRVDGAQDAEVCFTIESAHSGQGTWTYGDYEVVVYATGTDCEEGYIEVSTTGNCVNTFRMDWVNGKVSTITATSDAFLAEVIRVFNLSGCVIGTCVDCNIIQRNFGWDDEFENCFAWSDKGAAVVDPECVVAIPKTGDVSVVAYAVMAVVAAAGTMLKK